MNRGVNPDFSVMNSDSKTDFDYIHYTIAGKDVYFVSNQTEERQKTVCSFRVSGFRPEIWDALTGTIREAKAFGQHDGRTSVPLTFEPYGAVFIVFNEQIPVTGQGTAEKNDPDYRPIKEITGAWTVNFDPRWGGPEAVVFPELIDWTEHADERIKYYSGVAVYNKTFSIDFVPEKDKSYYLQLEDVKDVGIAVVTINGKTKGTVWTKPFRIDISGDLRTGDNTLEIKVVNSWFNRVAADEIASGDNRYTSTNIVLYNQHYSYSKDARTGKINLESSGLIGPVRIMEEIN
jgi:hypothetical protein